MMPASTNERPLPTLGVAYAVASATTFGVSTPLSRILLRHVNPTLLAALLYIGAAVGLTIVAAFRRRVPGLPAADRRWLAAATLFGGVLGPLLLLVGLRATPASTASVLLSLEGAFTALIAWRAFHEPIDRRVVTGIGLVVTGGLVLAVSSGWSGTHLSWGPFLIVASCACWALDNNLTRQISAGDPVQIVRIKCAAAGLVNLAIAAAVGATRPDATTALGTLSLGAVSYGLSLVLFVLALRHIGSARTGSWFSLAPFTGAGASLLLLHERPPAIAWLAAATTAVGLYLHATERHSHEHLHAATDHEHPHKHDDHHQHQHAAGKDSVDGHLHRHHHERLMHAHPHYPDTHHRHEHVVGPPPNRP